MNALTRTAVAAVLFLCLASAASAADGVGYGTGTGPDKDTSAVRTASQLHEAMQPYKTEEKAENVRNVQLTMNECRTITMDAALYHDTPADEFPPADQPMPILNEIFRKMTGMPWLQLVVTESREANDETAIQPGFPVRWMRIVDIARAARYRLEDGRQIVISQAFEGVHKQNAGKLFANDQNIFVYNADGHPMMRTDLFHLPDSSHIKSSEAFLRLAADSADIPLPEGSRAYTLAQHMLQTAVPAEIPAGK